MWKSNNRPGYYRGEQKNMRRNFIPLLSAVVGIVVLYLLWSNNNLQYELESSEFAKHSLTEDLIETKARHTQAESELSDERAMADAKVDTLTSQKQEIQDEKNRIKSELEECNRSLQTKMDDIDNLREQVNKLTIDAKCKDEVENNESLTKQNKNLDEQVKSLTKQLSDALDQLEALKLAQIEKNEPDDAIQVETPAPNSETEVEESLTLTNKPDGNYEETEDTYDTDQSPNVDDLDNEETEDDIDENDFDQTYENDSETENAEDNYQNANEDDRYTYENNNDNIEEIEGENVADIENDAY